MCRVHFLILVLEIHLLGCVLSPCRRAKIEHQVLAARRAVASNCRLPGSFDGPCFGLPRGPLSLSPGIVLGSFDNLHVILCIGTIETQIKPQTILQKFTTKQYDTLVQLRLVSGRLGRLTSKHSQTLQTDL